MSESLCIVFITSCKLGEQRGHIQSQFIYSTCGSSIPAWKMFCANSNRSETMATKMRETSRSYALVDYSLLMCSVGSATSGTDGQHWWMPGRCSIISPFQKVFVRRPVKRPAGSHHKIHGSATSSQCQYLGVCVCVWIIRRGLFIPPIKYADCSCEYGHQQIRLYRYPQNSAERHFSQNSAEPQNLQILYGPFVWDKP